MRRARRRKSGMTIVEMIAAIVILIMLTVILAQVFHQATRAASKGKAMAEVYQVARAVQAAVARDLSGATAVFFAAGENGLPFDGAYGMPPGPYHSAQPGTPTTDQMRRMLMGGSDFLAFTSSNAGGSDKGVAKVYYVLRASGEFVRIVDTMAGPMDYLLDAIAQNVDIGNHAEMATYEEQRVMAENVSRVNFSFFKRSTGPVSADGLTYADGMWLDQWDWAATPFLPAAVKFEIHIVDHLWKLNDEDTVTNRFFNTSQTDDALRASENFDPDDGDTFRMIIDIPLGTRGLGG